LPRSRKRKIKRGGASYRSTRPSGKRSGSKAVVISLVVVAALALAGVVYLAAGGGKSGLKIQDLVEGTGPGARRGQTVSVLYTGTLDNGQIFDKAVDRDKPFQFVLGSDNIIKGWNEGLEGMKVGGKRKLTIPPELGYGKTGFPPRVPPDATLTFEIELLDVK